MTPRRCSRRRSRHCRWRTNGRWITPACLIDSYRARRRWRRRSRPVSTPASTPSYLSQTWVPPIRARVRSSDAASAKHDPRNRFATRTVVRGNIVALNAPRFSTEIIFSVFENVSPSAAYFSALSAVEVKPYAVWWTFLLLVIFHLIIIGPFNVIPHPLRYSISSVFNYIRKQYV